MNNMVMFFVIGVIAITAFLTIHALTETKPTPCTHAISSINTLTNKPVTIWYPKGCKHG